MLVVALTTLFVFVACTGEAPVIHSIRYYTIASHNPQSGERSEALSLFLHVTHDDGDRQLAEWTVSHEDSQLYWEQTADAWERRDWDGRTWTGYSSLRAPERDGLPRGSYSVRVVDRGGRESVSEFELRTLDFNLGNARFPELSPTEVPEGAPPQWTVEHSGDRAIATLVDDQGAFLSDHEIGDGRLSLEDFDSPDSDEAAALYLKELRQRSEVWLVSGPWAL